jgi:gliding motility-associated-like protein
MGTSVRRTITVFCFSLAMAALSAQSSGGTLTGNATVCAGSNAGLLSVSNYSGTIQRWEYANSPNGPWVPLLVNSTSYYYTNLSQSAWFRVVVQLTGFQPANSNTVAVICDAVSVPGTISTPSGQCINTAVSNTLSGHNGTVLAWEYTSNAWISASTLITNASVATVPSLSVALQLRAVVKNGACPQAYSNTISLTPQPASYGGTVSGVSPVCASANQQTLTVNGAVGNIVNWENAFSAGGPFNVISGSSTTSSLSCSSLNQNTWFRAVVRSGNCPVSVSQTFSVSVHAVSNAGVIAGTSTICAGINNGLLSLNGHNGQVIQWQASSNNGSSWQNISSGTATLSFVNLSVSTIYRAQVQNGVCNSSISAPYSVAVQPAPSVTFAMTNRCAGTAVQFTNASTGALTYAWEFGDGGSAYIYSPSHLYNAAGSYTVKLTATTGFGCCDSLKKTVTVFARPVPGIVCVDTSCYGSAQQFFNVSTISAGSIAAFHFDFEDGSPVATVSPVGHIFSGDGVFPVKLVVISNWGCMDSVSKGVKVFAKPQCDFKVQAGCTGAVLGFTNQSNISSGALLYNWNFGNGLSSVAQSPTLSFTNAGIYNVSLICRSFHNCTDTAIRVLKINSTPMIGYSVSNVCDGIGVSISPVITPSNISADVLISFGDGVTATGPSGTHTYAMPGSYNTTVVAVSDSGCVSAVSKPVVVYPVPYVNYFFNNGCEGDTVEFNNASSIALGSLNYTWSFGGKTVSEISPGYKFTNAGSYSISLLAQSNFGCEGELGKSITVYERPVCSFIFNNACEGLPVHFIQSSILQSGVIKGFTWDFGDNTTSSAVSPSHEYLNPGAYTVSLDVLSDQGCSNSKDTVLIIYPAPVAKFIVKNHCFGTYCPLQNESTAPSGNFSSRWQFDDNSFDSVNVPVHRFRNALSYPVKLTIRTSDGCKDSTEKLVTVFGLPLVNAGRDTSIEKGSFINLNGSGGTSFAWFPANYLDNPAIPGPRCRPDSSLEYILEVTDNYGCKNTDTLYVKVKEEFAVYPYNIVTPDGNGMNDTWIIKNILAYPSNYVRIFDQWDQLLYQTHGYQNEWDGKNMKGDILPDGTYFYIIQFRGTEKQYSGFITLMRNRE